MLRQPQNILTLPTIQPVPNNVTDKSGFETGRHEISLALIRLKTFSSRNLQEVSYEIHVKGEAAVAVALAISLHRCCPDDDIFIATPHRIQRQAVKDALGPALQHIQDNSLIELMKDMHLNEPGSSDDMPEPKGKVIVDTIERLQGAFVNC